MPIKAQIPVISVSDNVLRKILQPMKERIESQDAAITKLQTTTSSNGSGTTGATGETGATGPQGPPGAGVTPYQDGPLNPTSGQTSFTLSNTPSSALVVNMIVNGVDLINGSDFTVSGTTVTVLSGLGYTLQPTDTVQFRYF